MNRGCGLLKKWGRLACTCCQCHSHISNFNNQMNVIDTADIRW